LTSQQLAAELMRLSSLIDNALDDLRAQATKAAHADAEYRKARAFAVLAAEGPTVGIRDALATKATADLLLARNVAQALEKSATEALRSRRQQLSAMQSMLSAYKAEAEFVRTRPSEVMVG
jgi:hypothetical protein